jgi:hypothetical protein
MVRSKDARAGEDSLGQPVEKQLNRYFAAHEGGLPARGA